MWRYLSKPTCTTVVSPPTRHPHPTHDPKCRRSTSWCHWSSWQPQLIAIPAPVAVQPHMLSACLPTISGLWCFQPRGTMAGSTEKIAKLSKNFNGLRFVESSYARRDPLDLYGSQGTHFTHGTTGTRREEFCYRQLPSSAAKRRCSAALCAGWGAESNNVALKALPCDHYDPLQSIMGIFTWCPEFCGVVGVLKRYAHQPPPDHPATMKTNPF